MGHPKVGKYTAPHWAPISEIDVARQADTHAEVDMSARGDFRGKSEYSPDEDAALLQWYASRHDFGHVDQKPVKLLKSIDSLIISLFSLQGVPIYAESDEDGASSEDVNVHRSYSLRPLWTLTTTGECSEQHYRVICRR